MKKAFTLMELIFVLVIMGILASVILPRTKKNSLQEAAIQLASHIKYTQHLAMTDDTYNSSDSQWYKARWQLVFGKNSNSDDKVAYTIFSDQPSYGGDANLKEIAINQLNSSQVMSGGYTGSNKLNVKSESFLGMKSLNLGLKYGITSYKLQNGCSGARISFDYLGRPLKGDSSSLKGPYRAGTKRLIDRDCEIIISDSTGSVMIVVKKRTGNIDITY
jgi:prepilin-type N-terminal cleavage/methylation domain-containing protein